jgi:hypothetical protein
MRGTNWNLLKDYKKVYYKNSKNILDEKQLKM